jgi:transposase-like protein
MTNQRYSAEFRDEAVRQVLDRGYSVKEVSQRLGVSAHSLYKWMKAVKPRPEKQRDEELLAGVQIWDSATDRHAPTTSDPRGDRHKESAKTAGHFMSPVYRLQHSPRTLGRLHWDLLF